jgi:hypothetical protein
VEFGDQQPARELANGLRFFVKEGLPPNPRCLVLDGPNEWIPDHQDEYAPHGYMTVSFNGPRLTETLHDADGSALFSQTLTD